MPVDLELDHLVVAASSLAAGVAHAAAALGVPASAFSPVGRHSLMGTHNRLISLGDGCYLEVIAVDPEAAPPAGGRPRWFGLDDAEVQTRLAERPCVLHWVARLRPGTGADIDRLAAADQQAQGQAAEGEGKGIGIGLSGARARQGNLPAAGLPGLPPPVAMERGDFRWRLCVPADGSLPSCGPAGAPADGCSAGGGVWPTVLQWDVPETPAQRLPPSGLRLRRLRGRHPQAAQLRAALERLGAGELIEVEEGPEATLAAEVQTAEGLRLLV